MQMWLFQLEEDKYLVILLNVSQSFETETGIHFGMFMKTGQYSEYSLKKYGLRVWTGLTMLKARTSGRFL
jgi:hypothetical protein